MNDENIKEILDFKENADYKRLSCDEISILKDYITNLQQENERLNTNYDVLHSDIAYIGELMGLDEHFIVAEDMRDWVKDYKSRIEKAVEYIKEHNMIVVNKEYIPDGISTAYDYELLNILNGKE